MKSVTFTLKTVTPMFMAGADGETAELRPSSFKGMIRFWWRAISSENTIETLAQEEAKLFGGTKSEKGQGKSIVSLRFINHDLQGKTAEVSLLLHKTSPRKRAIKPEQTLTCKMTFRDEHYEAIIVSSFKLSMLLGGFGKRSRRGRGSLLYQKFTNIDALVNELQALTLILSPHQAFGVDTSNPAYTLLNRKINALKYPQIRQIYIGQHFSTTCDNVLRKIDDASHAHKNGAHGALGNGNPRMASPVIVSVVRIGTAYHPIITKLSSYFPDSYGSINMKEQQMFIDDILK